MEIEVRQSTIKRMSKKVYPTIVVKPTKMRTMVEIAKMAIFLSGWHYRSNKSIRSQAVKLPTTETVNSGSISGLVIPKIIKIDISSIRT